MRAIAKRWTRWMMVPAALGMMHGVSAAQARTPTPAPTRMVAPDSLVAGRWRAMLPAGSGAGRREVTLELARDGGATLTTIVPGRSTVRARGRWDAVSRTRVGVDLGTGRSAEHFVFRRDGETLRALEYDRARWGSAGLALRRAPAPVPGPPLNGSRWTVQSIAGLTTADLARRRPTLDFVGSEWRVSGNAACNRYNGGYASTGSSLTFGEMASTRMACPAPRNTVERAWLDVLRRTARYEITRGILVLRDTGGRELARLRISMAI